MSKIRLIFNLGSLIITVIQWCSLAHADLLDIVKSNLDRLCTQIVQNEIIQNETDQFNTFIKIIRQELVHLNSFPVTPTEEPQKRKILRILSYFSSQSHEKENSELPFKNLPTAQTVELEILRTDLKKWIQDRLILNPGPPEIGLGSPIESSSPNLLVPKKGPRISTQMLISTLLTGGSIDGWELDPYGRHALIERTRDPRVNAHGETLLRILADDLTTRQISVFQAYDGPVALTPESEWFFGPLPSDLKSQRDGTLIGFQYIFLPNSILDTQGPLYDQNPKLNDPILFFLFKRVSTEAGLKYSLPLSKREEITYKISQELQKYTRFHEAQNHRKFVDFQKIARNMLRELADEGLARAQYELAILFHLGVGGPAHPREASKYARLAHAQGLPDLDLDQVMMTPYTSRASTGAVFTRRLDLEIMEDRPIWETSNGLTWFNIARTSSGDNLRVSYERATHYCTEQGKRLPSMDEFVSLKESLSYQNNEGVPIFDPQILPSLIDSWFWLSDIDHQQPGQRSIYNPLSGEVLPVFWQSVFGTRCVSQSRHSVL